MSPDPETGADSIDIGFFKVEKSASKNDQEINFQLKSHNWSHQKPHIIFQAHVNTWKSMGDAGNSGFSQYFVLTWGKYFGELAIKKTIRNFKKLNFPAFPHQKFYTIIWMLFVLLSDAGKSILITVYFSIICAKV